MIQPSSLVLDIGSNIGLMAGIFSGIVGPKGQVIAFEPNPVARRILLASLRRSRLGNVSVVDKAAGDVSGQKLTLQIQPFSIGVDSTVVKKLQTTSRMGWWTRGVSVESIKVDDVVDSYFASHESRQLFLKIDTEGFEEVVLEGAHHCLSVLKPIVLFEYGQPPLGEDPPKSVEVLRRFDYQIFSTDDFLPFDRQRCQPNSVQDLLAIHTSQLEGPLGQCLAHLRAQFGGVGPAGGA